MKGDFTRSTFKPEKHYSSVRMQQGRVAMDADTNEQNDIQMHLDETTRSDVIGRYGVPRVDGGFKIQRGSFNGVYFVGANKGWAVGIGATVVATVDGSNWTKQTPSMGLIADLHGVYFRGASKGWAVGDNGTILFFNGTGWTKQNTNITTNLHGVCFVNDTNGWAVGDNATILTTTDGGTIWTIQPAGMIADLHGVYFRGASKGWAVGDNGTILFFNGTGWTKQNTNITTNLHGVCFVNDTNGWAVGDNATILTTTDGGTIWTIQPAGVIADLHGVYFRSASLGWAIGDNGTILFFNGTGWTKQNTNITTNLHGVCFVNDTNGWAVGENAAILATTNSGSNWTIYTMNDYVTVMPGRIYVDGILCELEKEILYLNQPDYPDPPKLDFPAVNSTDIVYLDVWQRHITALEDPEIREVALGGPDTATRTKTVSQVKIGRLTGTNQNCLFPDWKTQILISESTGKLSVRSKPSGTSTNPCLMMPGSGYRRLENQLYRVEIHKPGNLGEATFKWSRDNGSIVSRWLDKIGNNLKVESKGRDENLGFKNGQQVELIDDTHELREEPGTLVKLGMVQGNILTIDNIFSPTGPTELEHFPKNPKVRRWDSKEPQSVEVPTENEGWLELEDGIWIKFNEGYYTTGDYWLIPARTINGMVEWPRDHSNNPLFQPAEGIKHHYCRLAMIKWENVGGQWKATIHDCRKLFPSLTELTSLSYISGDGQEAMPSNQLPEPLKVGVSNGQWPVEGALVRFEVDAGGGRLTATDPVSNNPLIVKTGDGGVAQCYWTLATYYDSPGNTPPPQRVKATLVDANLDEEFRLPVFFNANLSVASQVAYLPPTGCTSLVGDTTVKKAIDKLALLTSLSYMSGDGQEAMPGDPLPRMLQVIITNECGPVQDANVTFEAEGSGRVAIDKESLESEETTNTFYASTGEEGIATCYWQPDESGSSSQTMTATLIEAGDNPIHAPASFVFTASLSIATEVAYTPPLGCTSLADDTTVQEAIDKLALLTSLSYMSGDGQEAMPGDPLPQKLAVIATNECGHVKGAEVTFEAEGNGRVAIDKESLLSVETTNTFHATTGEDGIANCYWQPDGSGSSSQTMTATLTEAGGNPIHKPNSMIFTASLSIAAEVAYFPSQKCPDLEKIKTVQEAIDVLCDRKGIPENLTLSSLKLKCNKVPEEKWPKIRCEGQSSEKVLRQGFGSYSDIFFDDSVPPNLSGFAPEDRITVDGEMRTVISVEKNFIVLNWKPGWSIEPAYKSVGNSSAIFRIEIDDGEAKLSISSDGNANFAGNVGIGTTGPGQKLDVYGGQIAMRNTNNLWGSGKNKVRNGGFRYGYDGSSTGKGWGITDVTGTHDSSYPQVWESNPDWTLRDGDSITEGNYGSTLAVPSTYLNGEFYVYSDFIKLTAGRMHTFQALMGNHRMNWLKLRLVTYKSDKAATVKTYYGTLMGDGSTTKVSTGYGGSTLASGFALMWGTFTPGATEKYARIELVANGYASGNTNGWLFADQVSLVEGSQPLAWSPNTWEVLPDGNIYNSGGNVGIGTTNPLTPLKIAKDSDSPELSRGDAQLEIGGKTDQNKILRLGFETTNNYGFIQSTIWDKSGNALALNPDSGNVGIGMTNPSNKLSIGSSSAIIPSQVQISHPSSDWGLVIKRVANDNGNANFAFVKSRGETATPALSGDSVGRIAWHAVNNDAAPAAVQVAQIDSVIGEVSGAKVDGDLRFHTKALDDSLSERMRIDQKGIVGIGTMKPGGRLDVAGHITILGADGTALKFADASGKVYKDNWIGMADWVEETKKWLHIGGITDEGGDNLRRVGIWGSKIFMEGKVGIGTTSPITQLHVPGKVPSAAIDTIITDMNPTNMFVQSSYVYVVWSIPEYYGDGKLEIYDASNPASLSLVGSASAGRHPVFVHVRGRYAYVVAKDDNALLIFDVSNPSAPTQVGSENTSSYPSSLYVQGMYAFVTCINELEAFDISDPKSPVRVGSSYNLNLGPYAQVYVEHRYAYVIGGDYYGLRSLLILDISDPSHISELGNIYIDGDPRSIYVQGRYAYITEYAFGNLSIFDIKDPFKPSLISTKLIGINPLGIHVQGRYACIAMFGEDAVKVWDVSNVSSPSLVGTIPAGGNGSVFPFVQGRFVYVVNNTTKTLQSFDLGGSYIQQLEVGSMEGQNISLRGSLSAIDGVFSGGLIIGQSLNVAGRLGLDSGATIHGDVTIEGNLHVTRRAYKAEGGLMWETYNPSDIRLKKNVRSLKGSLDNMLKLRGISFNWKEPENHGNQTGKQMGLIANEVEKVFPEWVNTNPDGYKSLSIRGFEALVIETFRDINEIIEELEARIKTLEKNHKTKKK